MFPPQTRGAVSRRLIILICLLVLLGACASDSGDGYVLDVFPVWITDTVSVNLMNPASITLSVDEMQNVHAEWSERSYTMNAYLKADAEGLYMLGMGDMGQQLFELEFNSEELLFSGIAGTGRISPEYVVLDIQMALYDLEEVQQHLAPTGLNVKEEQSGESRRRTVSEDGFTILEIAVSDGRITLVNHLRQYSYDIIRESEDG